MSETIRRPQKAAAETIDTAGEAPGPAQREVPGIRKLLSLARERKASDLYLSVCDPPVFKVRGELARYEECPPLEAADIERLIRSILTKEKRAAFESRLDLEYSLPSRDGGTTRVTLFRTREGIGVACRLLGAEIPPLEGLGPAASLQKIASFPKGLVLVSGESGSGKTTTLASLVEFINTRFQKYIVTLEDPIEYVHPSRSSLVEQREVGEHTTRYAAGIRSAMRSDADVIVLSELGDPETISVALDAAESHLVLASCNVFGGAPWTLRNLLSYFSEDQKEFVRTQLARTVRAAVWQHLLPAREPGTMHPVMEIMLNNEKIAQLIRNDDLHKVGGEIVKGGSQGMQTMAHSISRATKILHSAAVVEDLLEVASLAAAFL